MLWEPLGRLLGDLGTVQREVLCRSYGNCRNSQKPMPKMDAQGWLWEPVGALEGLIGGYCTTLETVRATFWHNFGVLEATFGQHCEKKHNFMILTPLCSIIGGWGYKLEPSGLQGAVRRRSGRPKWPQTGPAERSGQQKCGKVWPVGSVLCRSYGTSSGTARTQPRPKSSQRSKSI